MATFGKIEEFSGRGEDFELYIERLEQYLLANDLDEIPLATDDANLEEVTARKSKRRAVLLSVVGQSTYALLRNLLSPQKPTDKTFEQIIGILKNHYAPTPSVSVQRYKFYSRNKRKDESVAEFVSELRKLAENCQFGETLEDMLRDRLVCGINDDSVQRRLFIEKDLNFAKALSIAQSQEAAIRNISTLQGKERTQMSEQSMVGAIGPGQNKNRPFYQKGKTSDQEKAKVPCFRCGLSNHNSEQCRYKNVKCYRCKKVGHMKSQCKENISKANSNKVGYMGGASKEGSDDYEGTDDQYEESQGFYDDAVFAVGDGNSGEQPEKRTPPIKIPVKVAGKAVNMELDTGTAFSVISVNCYNKLFKHVTVRKTDKKLSAYGGDTLPVIGIIDVDVEYEEQQIPGLPLYVVNVSDYAPPLLGRDWLFHIKVNWRGLLKQHGVVYNIKPKLESVLDQYEDLFNPELGKVIGVKASLHLKPSGRPKYHRPRPVPYALRGAVTKELERLESEGIIKPVDYSEWATPLVCVAKTDGSVRLCGDYKVSINPVLEVDQFPIPTPEIVFNAMANGVKFTKVDLRCAYQQLELDDPSQELVTINTLKGLYRYTRLPFGVASSPAIWQKFIEQVINGLDHTCAIMDDVLVSGVDDEDHLRNLIELFERFRKYGLRVKREKCAFMQDSVVYMGRRISANGLQPTEDKVMAIKKARTPENVTELRSFLGMVNFQGQFIPHLATISKPLTSLLGNRKWIWDDACTKAFQSVKEAISSDTLLRHFRPEQEVCMQCDASPYGIAAVLLQRDAKKQLRPVAYASRTLNEHEQNYAQLDKEGLSIIFGLKKFHAYLYGRQFTIMTDNKAIQYIMAPDRPIPTLAAQRLQRWSIMLSAFNYELKFISSQQNVLADALSRLPRTDFVPDDELNSVYHVEAKRLEGLPVTSKDIARATKNDDILSRVLRFVKDGWPDKVEDLRFKAYFDRRYELSTDQDCILWGLRVVIPPRYHEYMLEELHGSHAGVVRMKELARSFVWWPKIDQDIEELVRQCASCQQVRNVPAVAPLTPWLWPGSPWSRVHIDFAEKDDKHYLIVIDAYSKWPEIILMNSTTTVATVKVLRDLFGRYGLPHQIVSDNGPQFRSAEFEDFLNKNGVKHVKVAPYHPASNGMAERMVQSFKRCLSASKDSDKTLSQKVANFVLNYRSTPHATTGRTPSFLFLGRELRTRLTLVRPDAHGRVMNKQAAQKSAHDQKAIYREFYAGDPVLVKDLVKVNTWWQGTVVERSAPKSYIVTLRDGRVWKRHVDHLRRGDSGTMNTKLGDLYKDSSVTTEPEQQAQVVNPDVLPEPQQEVPHAHPEPEQAVPGALPEPQQMLPLTLRKSSRVSKAPDRLIESM
jgi:transposase InsO family protein